MTRKIFVSYKYSDSQVQPLTASIFDDTKVRSYVDEIEKLLKENDEIYKGERDGEDLTEFKDETIESRLRDKIYDSSITIVVISKGMKGWFGGLTPETDHWIPWEVSYSLKEHSRNGRVSRTNGVLAIVLPDEDGSYEYYLVEESCEHCKCRTLKTDFLFGILKNNMFNIKEPAFNDCQSHGDDRVYLGYSSFIHSVKWSDFKSDVNKYLDIAEEIRDKVDQYEITKVIA